jgi:hypothetical protein
MAASLTRHGQTVPVGLAVAVKTLVHRLAEWAAGDLAQGA